jgi:restriction system protein
MGGLYRSLTVALVSFIQSEPNFCFSLPQGICSPIWVRQTLSTIEETHLVPSLRIPNSSRRNQMFEKRIVHHGLNAYRLVKAQTLGEVEVKARLQEAVWAERWERKIAADRARASRTSRLEQYARSAEQAAAARAIALEQTRELELGRQKLETLLLQSLEEHLSPDWESRKDRTQFQESRPKEPTRDPKPIEPDPSAGRFNPVMAAPIFSILDKLIPSRKQRKLSAAEESHASAVKLAKQMLETESSSWHAAMRQYAVVADSLRSMHEDDLRLWESRKKNFEALIHEKNALVDLEKSKYFAKDVDSLNSYFEDVLSRSDYPDSFPREHRFLYVASTQALVLDYELPNQTALPKVKEVKYVAIHREFQEVPTSDVWLRKIYDEMLYQVALRTLYELFQSDEANALTSIVFNGWVRSIDRATGAETHACVMSLEARKDEFLAINLRNVDAKACFRGLKGVSASKLSELNPVKPLVLLNTQDPRFVDGYAMVDSLDDRTNLAAMDWLDFENLIREVFEKEFSKAGGEVKITQASRDGGVDAVAFDPDPIRGGKIVIQAKRYTNTVGVSAVRDLYGTVHNEGANKGILVTTSDFGPDAYAFAKDKPLTLLSGGELLYLLSQHGHSAKIDLAEAKRLAAENA